MRDLSKPEKFSKLYGPSSRKDEMRKKTFSLLFTGTDARSFAKCAINRIPTLPG
jgi:hypothetical protein